MHPLDSLHTPSQSDPYSLPAERHGWRGLSVPGHRKRKWWTLLHNDQVLVTALLLIPGEQSVRHSHESGELSIAYDGQLRPVVRWHPPGVVHPSLPPTEDEAAAVADVVQHATPDASLAEMLGQLLIEQREMRRRLDELTRGTVAPHVIVDVLFPPFKTTIEDPAYPAKITVTGQWFD